MWLERHWHLSNAAMCLCHSVSVQKNMKFMQRARQKISKVNLNALKMNFKINILPLQFCVLILLIIS